MSERQAKKSRKSVGEVKTVKAKADKSTILINIIVTVVVVAVLGLGIYAVAPKYIEKFEAQRAQKEAVEQAQQTVADFIDEKDLTFDAFMTEYGLAGDETITEETAMSVVTGKLNLENYAKYSDITLEELKAKYELGEDVPNTTIWQDAIYLMKTDVVAKEFFGTDFDDFKTQMGLPETITADTLWSETETTMNEIFAQQQAEAEVAVEQTPSTETETVGE